MKIEEKISKLIREEIPIDGVLAQLKHKLWSEQAKEFRSVFGTLYGGIQTRESVEEILLDLKKKNQVKDFKENEFDGNIVSVESAETWVHVVKVIDLYIKLKKFVKKHDAKSLDGVTVFAVYDADSMNYRLDGVGFADKEKRNNLLSELSDIKPKFVTESFLRIKIGLGDFCSMEEKLFDTILPWLLTDALYKKIKFLNLDGEYGKVKEQAKVKKKL